ncbi:MAG TPA: DUF1080 domain-containing protein [Burkholderiales bacterium]|nr:DUF1080 domain-containing protein [Burkholderiales bacterium]
MKGWPAIALLAAALTGSGCSQMPSGEGWITLLDGSTLEGWTTTGNSNWRIEDGVAVADRGNGLLVAKKTYTEFQLHAEFWVSEAANSGIYVRGTDPRKISSATAYEINIFDKRPDPSYGTGAIVGVAKVSPMPKAGGRWNVYDITVQGDRMVVVLNGVQTADVRDRRHMGGVLALQHGADAVKNTGIVKFRKVLIRPL